MKKNANVNEIYLFNYITIQYNTALLVTASYFKFKHSNNLISKAPENAVTWPIKVM